MLIFGGGGSKIFTVILINADFFSINIIKQNIYVKIGFV